uniref:Titin n=1 Tax=Anas platyrhynchos platyrhynchos TaxID=8840 RepID=A0A493TY77_ANAPP
MVPQKLEVIDTTKSTVTLAWEKPPHDGGSRLTGYVIEASKAGTERWLKVVTVKPTIYEHTIISLNEGEQYLFRVRAQNQKGVSEPREIVTAVTVQDQKDKPSQPGEIEITSIFKDSITLEWERPESDGGKEILGYWVEYRQSGESTWKKCNKERIKDRQFTVGGLLEATEYEFRVFAENQTGLSRPRRTAMAVKTKLTYKPDKPVGPIVIESILKNSVVISWQPPEDDGGAMITNYIIEKREAKEGTEWQLVSSSISGTTCRIVNLTENAGYYFRVSAQNTYGISEALEVSSVVVMKPPFGQPGQPVASAVTKDSCVVSWKPPASDGGAKIRTYYLEKREKKQNKWISVTTDEIRETVYSVKDLIEGLEYEFRVKCENLGGESEWSEVSQPVIPKSDVPIQAPHFKEELRNLNVKFQANATFVCKVTGHPKPIVKWYRQGKEIMPDGEKIKIQEFKGGYYQLVITNVTDDDATVYQVRATNQGGSVSGTASLDVEEFLHRHSIGHFDIRPDNIIYFTRRSSVIKIVEFGQARQLKPGDSFRLQFTSPEYYAPEVHHHDLVSTATDMWSKEWNTVVSVARISCGGAIRSQKGVTVAKVKVAPIDIGPIAGQINHNVAEEGGHAKYVCRIENYDQSTQVTWYFGMRQLESNEKYEIKYEEGVATMYVKDVSKSDDGTYRCKVVNDYGEDSSYAELFVKGVREISEHYRCRTIRKVKRRVDTMRLLERPPEFTLPLYNRTAYIGENVRFGVTITVHPEPRVTWFKSGQKIKPGDDDKKYTFESDKATRESLSSYEHYASSEEKITAAEEKSLEERTVHKAFKSTLPATILTKPRSITVSEGETARFSCDVDGEPAPTITWLRAGQPIVSSRRFQVTRTQYKSTFEISLVQMSDEGSYTVVVENSEGRQEAHFTLTIQRAKVPEKTITSPPRIKSPEPPAASVD